MEKIILSGKRELDIYVNPQRQNLLRCMRIASIPLTPKGIADRIGVSASSVQHHIRKLLEIGGLHPSAHIPLNDEHQDAPDDQRDGHDVWRHKKHVLDPIVDEKTNQSSGNEGNHHIEPEPLH